MDYNRPEGPHPLFKDLTEDELVDACKQHNRDFMKWLNYPDQFPMPGPHPDKGNDWNYKSWIWFSEDDPNKPSWWTPKPISEKVKEDEVQKTIK